MRDSTGTHPADLTDVFITGASKTQCDLLFNREWILRHWYQKPARFEDTKGYPQWREFLKFVTPAKPYYIEGKPHSWSPVQWYNTKWKPRKVKHSHVCSLLDAGESIALGRFKPNEKGRPNGAPACK